MYQSLSTFATHRKHKNKAYVETYSRFDLAIIFNDISEKLSLISWYIELEHLPNVKVLKSFSFSKKKS